MKNRVHTHSLNHSTRFAYLLCRELKHLICCIKEYSAVVSKNTYYALKQNVYGPANSVARLKMPHLQKVTVPSDELNTNVL